MVFMNKVNGGGSPRNWLLLEASEFTRGGENCWIAVANASAPCVNLDEI